MSRAEQPPDRLTRFRAVLDERGCSYAIAVGPDHAVHLAGYSRYLGAPTAVIVGPDAERTLVVARFERAAAEAEADVDAVIPYGGDDLLDFAPARALATACREVVGAKRLALAADPGFWSAYGCNHEQAVDVEQDLVALRRVKDNDELERIRAAFELALVGQDAVAALAHAERTEIELFTAAFAAAQDAAGMPIEFVGALASGEHTAQMAPPMHVPGNLRVRAGAPILCDIAVRYRGYWGDSTRTFAENDDAAAATEVLAGILDRTARAFEPGRRIAEVYADMHAAITTELPGASFPHHGGHGIGVGVGEDPQIIPSEASVVEAGMVFAIEPGAYWPGSHGSRVENTYVVEGSGTRLINA